MNRAFDGFDTATNPTVFPTKLNVQRAIFEDLFVIFEASGLHFGTLKHCRITSEVPGARALEKVTLFGFSFC